MNRQIRDIKDEFGLFASKFAPNIISTAIVTAINAEDTVAIRFSDNSVIDDARLRAIVASGNKVVLVPSVNSLVAVGKLENSDEYVVLVVSEVSEIKYVVDTVEYSVTAAGFLLQKGSDTLKAALIQLIEAIEPIIVLEGRNPDRVKLALAKTKVNNLLR